MLLILCWPSTIICPLFVSQVVMTPTGYSRYSESINVAAVVGGQM